MTDGDGRPSRGKSGEKITHRLERGNPDVIAMRLTQRIHRMIHGNEATNFNRPLNYPGLGLA
jgi:hypothetical protein